MVPLVQMLEILNIKVIRILMRLVIVYVIIAHYARFLMVSITLGTPTSNNNNFKRHGQLNSLLVFVMYLKRLCHNL